MSEHVIRSFSTLVGQLEDGELHQDMTEGVKNLTAFLQDHARDVGGKPKGKITLTIDVKFADGVFEYEADFKIASPKAKRRRTILWATPDNNLSRANPRQQELPLRTIDTGTAEPLKAV